MLGRAEPTKKTELCESSRGIGSTPCSREIGFGGGCTLDRAWRARPSGRGIVRRPREPRDLLSPRPSARDDVGAPANVPQRRGHTGRSQGYDAGDMPHLEWLGVAKSGAQASTVWVRVLLGVALGWIVVLIVLGIILLIR